MTYRSCVINYNVGKDLVRRYIEARVGPSLDTETRWREFGDLLASPRLPTALAAVLDRGPHQID